MERHKSKCLNEAKKAGVMDEASAKIAIAYMLITQAFSLYDDVAEALAEHRLTLGPQKDLADKVYKTFDAYIKDFSTMMSKEDARDFSCDYDRITVMIEEMVQKEMQTSLKRHTCEICGKSKPIEDFSLSYPKRCKECVAKMQREKRKALKNDKLTEILLQLDRKKMQARQISPNTIIVPYDRAKRVINDIINFYKISKGKKI